MDYAMVWRIILTKVALWLKYKVPNKVSLSLNKYNLKKTFVPFLHEKRFKNNQDWIKWTNSSGCVDEIE